MWALKVVDSDYSFKSCEKTLALFQNMFPDNEIASNFSCGEKKMAYLTVFGITPYFLDILKEKANKEDAFVLLFDESLNTKNQCKQLDCLIRFWCDGKVSSRYYSSDFLGHATADVLFDKISEK